MSQGNAMNRLSRLAGHLIQQQSFYPLFPPPPEGQAQVGGGALIPHPPVVGTDRRPVLLTVCAHCSV